MSCFRSPLYLFRSYDIAQHMPYTIQADRTRWLTISMITTPPAPRRYASSLSHPIAYFPVPFGIVVKYGWFINGAGPAFLLTNVAPLSLKGVLKLCVCVLIPSYHL